MKRGNRSVSRITVLSLYTSNYARSNSLNSRVVSGFSMLTTMHANRKATRVVVMAPLWGWILATLSFAISSTNMIHMFNMKLDLHYKHMTIPNVKQSYNNVFGSWLARPYIRQTIQRSTRAKILEMFALLIPTLWICNHFAPSITIRLTCGWLFSQSQQPFKFSCLLLSMRWE